MLICVIHANKPDSIICAQGYVVSGVDEPDSVVRDVEDCENFVAQISLHELLATCGVRCRRVVAASLASSHRCYISVGGRACVRA